MKNREKSEKVAGGDLLGMDEAIALLKTTRPTFYRWLKTGKLKGMKVGRQWRFYRRDVEGFLRGEGLRYDLPVGVEPLIDALRKRIGEKGAPVAALSDSEKLELASDLAVRAALVLKASDIHLDADREKGRLRCRVSGKLVVAAEFDARLVPALVARFKAWGMCDVNTKNVPQDARIQYRPGETEIDLLMSFLPSLGGETMTIRILDRSQARVKLEDMVPNAAARADLVAALSARSGMVIVAGPVASGKTTTLYAAINHVATPENKVVSVEDPVDYVLPGVVQVPVNRSAGLTMGGALRAVLRSDPNVIVVGEIRDAESADLACKAALTGHLVLTAMNARDVANVLTRLSDFGVAPETMAEALRLVTCQRLVRRVCRECGAKDAPAQGKLDWARETAAGGGLPWQSVERHFRKEVGCPKCGMTGFRGRALVIEALKVDAATAAAIRGGDFAKVREQAVKRGMRTMEADAVRQAGEGITSIGEARMVME